MNGRQMVVKTILWALVGVLGVVTVARFLNGLGTTTGLTDAAPWGFWIAFDVMAGVALAAGGFVLAATTYIFRLRKYRHFARSAILTALLGYMAVAVGLLYDLGLPWHIWHPMIYPQAHSVLFEVAMCVMLYLTVLLLEFGPVVLEHPRLDRPIFRGIHKVLKSVAIPLVIAGIVLSTLHQSSLGSLFLIAPYRLHPLWYSPIIWVLFFISAVGLGLMMVTLESLFSAWLFGHKLKMQLMGGLAKAASTVLFVYVGRRLADLAVRGVLGQAFDGSGLSLVFLLEILVSVLLPATLLAIPRVRASVAGLSICSILTVMGMIGYRFNVCIVGFARPQEMPYWPTWMELAVSLGIVALALLVFIFFVENFRVYPEEAGEEEGEPAAAPARPPVQTGSMWPLLPRRLAAPRRFSLAALIGCCAALTLLPEGALFGAQPERVPVTGVREVEGVVRDRAEGPGHEMEIARAGRELFPGEERATLMVIDGNRDGRSVLFRHDVHQEALGGLGSCVTCHHHDLPLQKSSACSDCHLDMYSPTDIFDHASHVDKLDGNRGCRQCHADTQQVKDRPSSTACTECHAEMRVESPWVPISDDGRRGLAAGYMQAMHGLCIECHEVKLEEAPEAHPANFAECQSCHRTTDEGVLLRLPPYVLDQGIGR